MCLDVNHHLWLLNYDVDTGLLKLGSTNPEQEQYDVNQSDLVIKLVLPLCDGQDQAGDTELGDLEDDQILDLPLDLQYLDESVTREADPEMRQLMVECIWLLCSTKKGRLTIRNAGIYQLIKRLHHFECNQAQKTYRDKTGEILKGQGENSSVAEAELKLIELLIADETDQPELENLLKVEIPENVQEELVKIESELKAQKLVDDTAAEKAEAEKNES